ncbi:MAG: Xre family DNA-binding domain and repeat containing protein [Clostridiales bacterium]|jgi:tetratricopeptide (TPR) repeat protein|nr:Xre family DNA-binding domain and repeat containing protein [Clostridiales bacterium]
MEILSPGKKMKRIRKDLKIRQQDITGGVITRELISIIENDKSKLTPNVAQIVTDNINRICLERNIDFTLDVSYLLEDIITQENKEADKYIEFLCNNGDNVSNNLTDDINKIEKFLMNCDIREKKMIIYEKIGDILKKRKEYSKCSIYYIKAFENYDRSLSYISLVKLLQKIGSVFIILTKYREALDFNNLALSYTDNITADLKYKLLFNSVLAHIYLKKYNEALNGIDYIEATFKNLTRQSSFELSVLKVNCLRWLKLYSDALQLNENLLNSLAPSETENRILITGNIIDIYTVFKDTKKVTTYLDRIIYLVNHFVDMDSSYHGPNIYRQIGLSAHLIGDKQLAKKYYENSIKACKKHRNIDVLEKSLDDYLSILIEEKNEIELNKFKNELIELVSQDIIKQNNISTFKLINYYNSINDRESIKNLLDFILSRNAYSWESKWLNRKYSDSNSLVFEQQGWAYQNALLVGFVL